MIVRDAGAGGRWYALTVAYPTALMARRAWERVDRRMPRGSLGFYRHGPSDRVGTMVTVISLDRAEVERVARLLDDGAEIELEGRLLDRMILRRAAVVVEADRAGENASRLKWRRPEGAGAYLDDAGRMHPPRREG